MFNNAALFGGMLLMLRFSDNQSRVGVSLYLLFLALWTHTSALLGIFPNNQTP